MTHQDARRDHRTRRQVARRGARQQIQPEAHHLTQVACVAVGFNVAQFDGYNLALRIRHAGYTNVYWYRGGREAWEVAGKPEDVMRPADW